MDAREALKTSIDMGQFVATSYLADLTDEQMLHRPGQGCNHIKWQLGHLISSEHGLMSATLPGSMPPLPAGFSERYTKETAASNNPADFHTKAELLQAFEQQRAATLASLAKQSDEALSKPAPEKFRSFAPTVGAMFELQGSHYLMHAGQWAVIRRQLGKPPLF